MKYAPALFGLAALLAWEAAVRITDVPSYLVPGPLAIIAAFLADPAGLLLVARIDAAGDLRRTAGRGVAGRRARGGDRIEPIAGRGNPAMGGGASGHADRRDRAADHRLGRRSVRLAGGLRDDRRVLPGVRQHRGRTGIGASRTCRSVPPVWRQPLRHAVAAAPAGSAAVFPRRPAHLRRIGAGRRGRGGVRRRLRRVRVRVWRIAFWRRAIACRYRACSPRWCCCRWRGSRSTSASARSPQQSCAVAAKPEDHSAASLHPVGRTTCCSRSRYASCQSSAASIASPLRTCLNISG